MPDTTCPPALRRRFRTPPLPPPAPQSACLLVRLAPADTGFFRFLFEAYENLGYFTVLEPRTALLKVIFSPQHEAETRAALSEMGQSLSFCVEEWPFPRQACGQARGKRL
ncbi:MULTISPECIES: DUF4911 domain-containing protein [unclassified Desulfovibrio]|uniref:DUF4911 domain-containing protein n=1 Tax=unclassified Desulfovibrio TaxID=2593640 RepID=UPI000F6039FC|nr:MULTISPECIES: DUF4911 domain-containing protein [unclassified Desulfovibrio]RRD70141.1 DUF4911 domain-containing protein [Desulfovibrio sp. OH1209_COT-279]RRD86673.1 DUF4911 domain-containing protein [Desulfovibrio sp. OH1186_COT-070]